MEEILINKRMCEICHDVKICGGWYDGEYANYICKDCCKKMIKIIIKKESEDKGE